MSAQTILPIHFFTIVLDGEPYIRHHLEVFKSLRVPWHWHIVEGVASLSHDTAWSVAQGGRVPSERYPNGRSSDGTSQYIDQIAREYPSNISVYRKPEGVSWDGKIEMVRAPLARIRESCLLWQVDSDELWTADQIHTMHEMFLSQPDRHAAWFWCHYFVGPDKVLATRNCYAQNPNQEWLRVWRYVPSMEWAAHEPPRLIATTRDGQRRDVGQLNPFTHRETENAGLVFQHMSYTTEAQVRFKEEYYGYKGAVERWRALQQDRTPYTLLRTYFPWVSDSTLVESATRRGIVPLFSAPEKRDPSLHAQLVVTGAKPPRIAIDGVFFQLQATGIARMWRSILECWARAGHADEVLLLDRAGTMPSIPGFRYRQVASYEKEHAERDRTMLQKVLDEEGVKLFASTYYTSPLTTASLQVVYDMIPEVLQWNLTADQWWIEKKRAFSRAVHWVSISENTRKDLHRFYPAIPREASEVIYPGIDLATFASAPSEAIVALHQKYSLSKPYFLMVGSGAGYKNAKMVTQALSQLISQHGFEVILVTNGGVPGELAEEARTGMVRALPLNDAELRAAYSGALAYINPSLYEGFGLPILEAMACNCPVISNRNSSLTEVGGDAVLYASDVPSLAAALCEVQKPEVQNRLIQAGRQRTALFSWDTCAEKLWDRIRSLSGVASEGAVLPPPIFTHIPSSQPWTQGK
ncbi:MAG: hypothetical protein RL518_261 [Pseudomonadota bacterium]